MDKRNSTGLENGEAGVNIKPRFWRQLLAAWASSMAMSGWSVGLGLGSQYALELDRGIGGFILTEEQQVWTVSSNFIGAAVGCALAGVLSSRFGARNTMLWMMLPTVVGYIIVVTANSFLSLLIGRLVIGLCAGPALVVHLYYLSAVASPQYRGGLVMFAEPTIISCTVLALLSGAWLNWRFSTMLSGGLTLCCTVPALMLLPSDPLWLARRGRLAEAKLAAHFFGIEMTAMEPAVVAAADGCGHRKVPAWRLLLQRRSWLPLLLAAAAMFCNACSGFGAVISYCLVLLPAIGCPLDVTLASVLICVIRLVGSSLMALVVERAGRRPLMLGSLLGMVVSYMAVAACFYFPPVEGAPGLAMGALLCSVVAYCVGVGPVPWVLTGELVPARLAQTAGTPIVTWFMLCSIGSVQLFPRMLAALGVAGTFAAHAAMLAGLLVLLATLLPETRGLTLAQVETLFDDRAHERSDTRLLTSTKGYNTFSLDRGG